VMRLMRKQDVRGALRESRSAGEAKAALLEHLREGQEAT
jgi:hypothetical protein